VISRTSYQQLQKYACTCVDPTTLKSFTSNYYINNEKKISTDPSLMERDQQVIYQGM
jgi:hypothetical protein